MVAVSEDLKQFMVDRANCYYMKFPGNKKFAFTILDDTDDATLENVKPVYDCLKAAGFRTTKTVWPMDCPEGSRLFFAADTLQRKEYLSFVHQLAKDGFEIAFHGATMESSRRARTVEALEFFKEEFGVYPTLFCSHGYNRDNLYWGHSRFQTWMFRNLMGVLLKESRRYYAGAMAESEYFWGDISKAHIRYVRNFTFSSLNMLEVNPEMPYRLSETPYVNYWFSTADAADASAFIKLLTDARLDALERAGGVCILSTHLGKGFAKDGVVNPRVTRIIQRLGQRPGWYIPTSELLDYLVSTQGKGQTLGTWQMLNLEVRYVFAKFVMTVLNK